jgi:putative ABC transport system substrate-binding protein
MKRREFIRLLGSAAAAWPLAARAQQSGGMRRIGVLIASYAETDREGQARVAVFLDTFRRLGWSDGRNVRIDYRWGAGDADRSTAFAAELVRSAPDVIVAVSNPTLAELQRLTRTIPIVFAQVSDPVGSGFVAGIARPGGNITGFQNFEPTMGGKWLGVLKEAAPNLSRAAVLFGSDNAANVAFLRAAEAVAPSLGVQVTAVDIHADAQIERVIATSAC